MSYTVELPDGRSVEFPDDVPKEKAAEIIRTQLGVGGGKTGEVKHVDRCPTVGRTRTEFDVIAHPPTR
jgi:hypothetical protein